MHRRSEQWMIRHTLLLNDDKTEAIVIATPNRKHLQDMSCVNVCRYKVVPSPTIRNIGITIECGLTMSSHVSRTYQLAYFQLYNMSKIIHCLPLMYARLQQCSVVVDFPFAGRYSIKYRSWSFPHYIALHQHTQQIF